jgi:hypothetical protein
VSLVSDHLTDDSCRGMYGPSPEQKVTEAMRLAGLLATARVRRYVFQQGLSQLETQAKVDRRVSEATKALRDYLEKELT